MATRSRSWSAPRRSRDDGNRDDHSSHRRHDALRGLQRPALRSPGRAGRARALRRRRDSRRHLSQARRGRPGTFLLESAEQGGIWSRYSFVGAGSYGVLTEHDGQVRWLDYGIDARRALGEASDLPPLAALEALYERWATEDVPGAPPLTGGLVGFIGWEAIRQIEHLPNRPPAEFSMPGQAFAFVSELVVIDHRTGTVQLSASALTDSDAAADALWTDAQSRLDRLQAALAAPAPAYLAEIDLGRVAEPSYRTDKGDFLAAVERSKEYIREGDIFQVVVSQRFEQAATADPIDVYRVLRSLNPSPYMYFLHLEDTAGEPYWIVGSSPEALVKVEDGRVFTHPIAGSKPRGATPDEDADLESELVADPKE